MIALFMTVAGTGWGSLSEILKPLEYLDVSQFYDRYAVFIDLVVYLMVFVGLAQVTLGKRFQGRGGKVITIAIGSSLAISLAIAEKALGFSLKSFGPIAAGIFLTILAVMIYRLIKYLGGGFAVSGSLAYIVILLFLTAAVPGFFAWINKNAPLLNLGLVIGFFWALYNLISHIFRGKKLAEKLQSKLTQSKDNSKTDIDQLNRSRRFQKSNIRAITRKARKDSRFIIDDLIEIKRAIEKYGHLPDAKEEIKKQIDGIMPEQHELIDYLNRLQSLHRRLLSFDTSVYSNEVQARYRSLAGPEKSALKKELEDEYQKLGVERQLLDLEEQARRYQEGMKAALNQAGQSMMSGDIDGARAAIDNAIKLEQETSVILDQLRYLERQILRHTKHEISIERQLAAA